MARFRHSAGLSEKSRVDRTNEVTPLISDAPFGLEKLFLGDHSKTTQRLHSKTLSSNVELLSFNTWWLWEVIIAPAKMASGTGFFHIAPSHQRDFSTGRRHT